MKLRFLAAFGGLICATLAGQTRQESLRWSELGPRITEKKVALVLPDGTRVQGRVRSVDTAVLWLDVSKTSDKKTQPKGLHSIPRQSLSVLQVTEYRKTGRLLCTLGAVATAGALVLASRGSTAYEGPLVAIIPAVEGVGTVGIGVGAYFVGKAVDKRVTVIRVAPGD